MLMRITMRGQVTIPAEIRKRAGLLPHTEVEFEFDGRTVTIKRAARTRPGRGAGTVAHLRGQGDVRMSTDAIMALTRGSPRSELQELHPDPEFDPSLRRL